MCRTACFLFYPSCVANKPKRTNLPDGSCCRNFNFKFKFQVGCCCSRRQMICVRRCWWCRKMESPHHLSINTHTNTVRNKLRRARPRGRRRFLTHTQSGGSRTFALRRNWMTLGARQQPVVVSIVFRFVSTNTNY